MADPDPPSLDERKFALDRERFNFEKRWLNRYPGIPAAIVAFLGVGATIILSYNQLVLTRKQADVSNELSVRQQDQKQQETNLGFGKLLVENKDVLDPSNAGSPAYDGFWKVMAVLYTEQSKHVFDALQGQATSFAENEKVGNQRQRIGLTPAPKQTSGGTLYIQYQAPAEKPKIETLQTRLRELGWNVAGLDARPKAFPDRAEVRYFHVEDEVYGEKVAAATQESIGRPVAAVFVKLFPSVLSRTCEIWIPARTP